MPVVDEAAHPRMAVEFLPPPAGTTLNIRWANAISDLGGATGLAMVRAMLQGGARSQGVGEIAGSKREAVVAETAAVIDAVEDSCLRSRDG